MARRVSGRPSRIWAQTASAMVSVPSKILHWSIISQKHGIGLEACPTSNLHTSTVENYASHPIKPLADQGVKFCLNTDDPGISAIDIKHEYEIAAPATGLSREQVHQSQLDGLEMAFLSTAEKSVLKDKATQRGSL